MGMPSETKTSARRKNENDDDDDVTISQLMSFTGVHRMSKYYDESERTFGRNAYRRATAVQIILLQLSLACFVCNAYYCWGNVNEVNRYVLMGVESVIASLKVYCISKNADRLYECVRSTSFVNLSYRHHARQTLELGANKSRLVSMIFVALWTFVLAAWSLAPLAVDNLFVPVVRGGAAENSTYLYRYNVANLVFPTTDTFYNRHFFAYYVTELIIVLNWTNGMLIFDVLVISLCILIRYQLKTIVNSYTEFSAKHKHSMGDKLDTTLRRDSNMIFDFRALINDQQVVIENIRIIYQIFRPVLFIQLGTDSMALILLSSITIKNYYDGHSLLSPLNIRPIMTLLTFLFHIYLFCYLFDDVNEQKDTMNFAMYCSDWTETSIHYKKLLLLAMRTNDGDNLKLRISTKRVINFEMFASVMQTTYSILSLLANHYRNN